MIILAANISFIVFNKNYSSFIEALSDSFERNGFYNDENVNFIMFDDGSDDDSVDKFLSIAKKYSNVKFVQLNERGFKRQIKSGGQLDALEYAFNKEYEYLNEYVHFFDCDDSIKDIYDYHKISGDVCFSKLNYISKNGNIGIKEIERKVNDNSYLWPTITATSGLTVSKNWFYSNIELILDRDERFAEVWFDSRINILAKLNCESAYVDNTINRFVHEQGDSSNKSPLRHLTTQVQTMGYMLKHLKREKFKITPRALFLISSYYFWKAYVHIK